MKKRRFGIGAGSASILMIFVVLCLTTFAALSFVSASADRRMAEKAALSLTRYYEADSRATELLAELKTGLANAKAEDFSSLCEEKAQALGLTSEAAADGVAISGSVRIDGNRRLDFSARAAHDVQTGCALTVTEWKTVPDGEWENNDAHPLLRTQGLPAGIA